jgi:hypothetical protein
MTRTQRFGALAVVTIAFSYQAAFACACGCNVFAVGTRWTMPTSEGLNLSLQYNYMNQSRIWSRWNNAPAGSIEDLELRSNFYTVGLRYMPSRDWGVAVETPVWNRFFKTTDEDGNIASANHTSLGDIRLMGMFAGLSEDMSVGLQFGIKLPTGAFTQSLLDRDTQIGTGTTDLLLGGYRMSQENGWGWYAQAMWQRALNSRDGYRPGDSFDMTGGIHYDKLLKEYRIIPMLQLVASFRAIDSGPNAEPENTGYERLYISPGIKVAATSHLNFYADVRLPLVTHVGGFQLVAPSLISIALGYNV